MRKILLILILLPVFSYGQITVATGDYLSSVDGTNYGSVIGTVTGRFYIVIVESNSASAEPNLTLTIGGNSPTLLTSAAFNTTGTARNKIWAYYFLAATTAANSMSLTFSTTVTGFRAVTYDIEGSKTTGTNGIDAITQYTTGSVDAGTNPSLTLSPLHGQSLVVTGFANDSSPFGATCETGWTCGANTGHDGGGFFYMYRINGGDMTPTVTAASSNWGGIAIEIGGLRRIVNVN